MITIDYGIRKELAEDPGARVEARYGRVQNAVCASGHMLPPNVENRETGQAANPSHTPQTSSAGHVTQVN
jgi:hypothetical protein